MIQSPIKTIQVSLLTFVLSWFTVSCDKDNDFTLPETGNDSTVEQPEQRIPIKIEDLTLEEKVAQMFIVHPEQLSNLNPCTQVDESMVATVAKIPVGGIILFGDNIVDPPQLRKFTTGFNQACKYPPFIAVDEEGGSVARIAKNKNFYVETFPSMMEIGNTADVTKAYYVGNVIGDYLKKYGFNLDFAPVADIFSNPANTVIGKRAFGTTAEVVSPMVASCAEGLHSQGIYCSLKHFPGHGDTDTDSHTSLPLVTKTWEELLELELIPFRDNFSVADMIMIAHIAVTEVNEQIDGKTVPSTLSYNMLTLKLRNELGYKGVIITDAFGMGALTNFFSSQGEAAVQAVKAGVDIILCPSNFQAPEGPYYSVIKAVKDGEISLERINESVTRILELKNRWIE